MRLAIGGAMLAAPFVAVIGWILFMVPLWINLAVLGLIAWFVVALWMMEKG